MTKTTEQQPGPPAPADGGPAEVVAGGILVGVTLVGAIVVRIHPQALFLDRWGFSFIHPAEGNALYERVADLHSTSFLVAGSILAAVVVVGRDRWRALACLVGPALAVVLAEWVLKPLIGRRYAEVLTYPSGTTTAVAGVVAAWAVAVTHRIRPVVVVIGAFVLGLTCIAVVALQWHYPTDALAGVAFGTGVVLLLDGGLRRVVAAARRVPSGSSAGPESAPRNALPPA